ncbi:MAG: AI-2E family transporter [Acidimicrobiia bacterium]
MAGEAEVRREPVPWRTIWAVIFSAGATFVAYRAVVTLGRVLTWLVVALFFTVVLNPVVDLLNRKAHLRRGLATFVVLLFVLGALVGMLYAFIRPLVDQVTQFSDDLPGYVEDARNGEGVIGDLVERFELEERVRDNQAEIQDAITGLGQSSLDVLGRVFSTLFAFVTILVLTALMLMQGPHLSQAFMALIPDDTTRLRVRRVAADAARSVSGYVAGNLLISVIAGSAAWAMLLILGVPYAGVLGLFVAFTDLIPLVGATLGAVPTAGFAFLHSVPAGIAAAIFFVIYQQFENHFLQVAIMSRTVHINPLTVLVSVLVGVELFGFLGALLAIPAAGVIQVVARDIYDERRGRLKPEPTLGSEEVPVSTVERRSRAKQAARAASSTGPAVKRGRWRRRRGDR